MGGMREAGEEKGGIRARGDGGRAGSGASRRDSGWVLQVERMGNTKG